MLTTEAIDIGIRLLAGHVLGDFLLQPDRLVAAKRKNGLKGAGLYLHALIASLAVYACMGIWALWPAAIVLWLVHLLTDAIKLRIADNLISFLADQFIHLVSLAALLWYVITFYTGSLPQAHNLWYIILAAMLVMQPAGIVIGKILQIYKLTPRKAKNSNVGVLIGYVERLLILVFIFTQHFEAIGFLVAAKSILRVSDVKKGGQSKAEYYLLGTLLSFGAAIGTGIIINYLMLC